METNPATAPSSRRTPTAEIFRAAFWTLTLLGVVGSLLTTVAYFTTQPAWLAQLSPFRVQWGVLLGLHALLCLALRRFRWSVAFLLFSGFNFWAVLRPGWPELLVVTDASAPPLRVILANVQTSNRAPEKLLAWIQREEPEVVALLETDQTWLDQLEPALREVYPHRELHPRPDNFGLAVFSRLPIEQPRLLRFADPELPSLEWLVTRGRHRIRVLLTHPLPPGGKIGVELRDKQLAEIARWAKSSAPNLFSNPTMIIGDMNGTLWCPPLRRLLAEGGLHSAARGHAYFPATWPTAVPFLRIPIDHALLGDGLACEMFQIGPAIGSDHFPLLISVRPTAALAP